MGYSKLVEVRGGGDMVGSRRGTPTMLIDVDTDRHLWMDTLVEWRMEM